MLVYHIYDIAEYLMKFEHITNNMAILDRSFVEMAEVLNPIYVAAALLCIHITRPFHHLIIDVVNFSFHYQLII